MHRNFALKSLFKTKSGGSPSHLPLRSASSDEPIMTRDEEMIYEAILEEKRRIRKEQQKSDIKLYKARANFDPMARKKASEAANNSAQSSPAPPPPAPKAAPSPPLLSPMQPPRPRQPLPTLLNKEEPEDLDEDDEEEEDEEIDEAAFEQAALAFLEKEKTKPPPTSPSRRVTIAPGSYKRSATTPLDSLNSPRPQPLASSVKKSSASPRPDVLRRQEEKLRKMIEEEDEGDEAEELDWDTLKAGESFEKYLTSLSKEEEGLKIQRKRAEAVKSRSSAPQTSSSPKGKDKSAAGNDDLGALGLEELLKLVEMVGSEVEVETSAGPSLKSVSTTTAAGKGKTKGGEDINWSTLEKMFLGDGWDDDIKDLAEKAQAAEAGDQSLPSQSSPESPPWGDEVTSLLLGLVSISHERYLNKPLFEQEVSEEDRADVFFKAHFALLVHDNSQEAMLEYCNEKALDLVKIGSFEDIYSLSTFDVVEDSDVQQQDWLWAISEVEEKTDKFTLIPEVRFRGGSVGKNVLVFRLDNLEGEGMGQAILIRDI